MTTQALVSEIKKKQSFLCIGVHAIVEVSWAAAVQYPPEAVGVE